MQTTLLIVLIFGVVSCSNGGKLTTEPNASFGTGSSKLAGSCQAVGSPIVMNDGYCTEFMRPSVSADEPGQKCATAGGTFSTAACPARSDKTGRCWVRAGGSIDLTYFAGTTSGPSQCTAADGSWQDGTLF